MRYLILTLLCGIFIVESCSTPGNSRIDSGGGDKSQNIYQYVDENIEIFLKNDTNTQNTVYSVYFNEGLEVAKYHLIGTIRHGMDTIQLVHFLFFFNIEESTRCNSKILVYKNRELIGYYYVGGDDFFFMLVGNTITCYPKGNNSCVSFLDFNPDNPGDWFILYENKENQRIGDSISFEKTDSNIYDYDLPRWIMFMDTY